MPGERIHKRLRGFLALLTAFAFLLFSSGCSHSPKKFPADSPREGAFRAASPGQGPRASYEEEPWWKKDENQWLLATLIVLGVGIAASAAVFVAFGRGGLTVSVRK